MTFSIVGYDPEERAWGVAVASKFLAVGAMVPWARAGAGAVATQSYANTSYGPRGLEMMASGLSADETLARLLENDPEREKRQVGLIDSRGEAAAFTGKACHPWAGDLTGKYFAIQGNILVGPQVVEAMTNAFLETEGNLPARLYAALLAGDRAGGDRRGRQAAAIYVVKPHGGYGGFTDRWVDYRVDDHPDPVTRLGELLKLHDLYFGKSAPRERLRLEGEVLRRLQDIMRKAGHYHGESTGEMDAVTRKALDAFIGSENFEERYDPEEGWIDRPVFDFLASRFLTRP